MLPICYDIKKTTESGIECRNKKCLHLNVALDEQGILQVGFGEPADNDQIVKDCAVACEALSDKVMGRLLQVNGRASLQAAMVICHAFAHLVPAIAAFDPKLGKFVVVVSHNPNFSLGQLLTYSP